MPMLGRNYALFSVAHLNRLFAGKPVVIIDSTFKKNKNGFGICKSFQEDRCQQGHSGFEVTLNDGSCWGIVPDTITTNSVAGRTNMGFPGRREIRLA